MICPSRFGFRAVASAAPSRLTPDTPILRIDPVHPRHVRHIAGNVDPQVARDGDDGDRKAGKALPEESIGKQYEVDELGASGLDGGKTGSYDEPKITDD